jgi:3-oxoacyl-[acyl-carrier-protein] synthase-3
MALFSIPDVKIAGVAGCVPKRSVSNMDYEWISEKERNLLIKTTGIAHRRVADEGVTTSDLCAQATQKLMTELDWEKDEVQLVVFISQSRDYFLPATAIILQDRLGFPKTCMAFDISLGCSGYVYGLSVVASLVRSAQIKKALLMVGDISTFSLNYKDKSTYPLFGDAGTVTALSFEQNAAPMQFNLQSDGAGYEAIIIPDGGLRNPLNDESFVEKEYEGGLHRTKRNLTLEGLDVFNFSLREVAPNIRALYEFTGTDKDSYDYYVFHQANKLMNESIRKKLKLEPEKVPYSLGEFGNTSSASIPLTIVTSLRDQLKPKQRFLFSGFGVGLSWGSVAVETEDLVVPALVEYEASETPKTPVE